MSFNYPTQASALSSNGNVVFYPHSMNVLTPRQGEFQSFQQGQIGTPNTETKSIIISKSQVDSVGTPLKQQISSSVNLGQAADLSSSSPYRVITSNHGEATIASPYKSTSIENGVYSSPSAGLVGSSGFRAAESIGMPQSAPSNVIYSSQPLTSADFGGMMMGSNGSYYQPMSSSGFSQIPMPMPMGGGFSQMSMPMSGGYLSTAAMTPRLLMNGSQGLTPRTFTSSINLPTTGQMGLTPRAYQEQMSMSMTHNYDPMMMVFAESFRNQCLAMSQYYAAHPEELVDSPKSSKVFADVSPTESAATMRRRMQQASSLKTIHDQENCDTSNVTPQKDEKKIRMMNDDIMDILNQMTEEDDVVPASPAREGTRQVPACTQGPISRAKPQSIWHRLGCGTLLR